MKLKNKNFGWLLRVKRVEKGLLLRELSPIIGIHTSRLSILERKMKSWKDFPYNKLEDWADALGHDIEDLIEGWG